MVSGIEKFKEYFSEYRGQYTFIGGTACDIILGRSEIAFRATKDLDIVLIMEAVNNQFVDQFAAFVEAAGYQHINKSTGENQYYRFEKPKDTKFPYMVELFSRRPDYLLKLDNHLAPIHISDDVISLSAILLNDEYYSLLQNGIVEVDGISVLDLEYLILFKIKAWLDLSERKNRGEQVDSKSIKKHINDVMRLGINISPQKYVEIHGQIENDVLQFLNQAAVNPIDVKILGIRGITYQDILKRIRKCYFKEI